jgi:hypothetical protein
MDCSGVKDKEEISVHILYLRLWLGAGVGVANSNLYLFEKCFNRVLKIDWRSHLVIVLGELSRIDEPISLFEMHKDF